MERCAVRPRPTRVVVGQQLMPVVCADRCHFGDGAHRKSENLQMTAPNFTRLQPDCKQGSPGFSFLSAVTAQQWRGVAEERRELWSKHGLCTLLSGGDSGSSGFRPSGFWSLVFQRFKHQHQHQRQCHLVIAAAPVWPPRPPPLFSWSSWSWKSF